MSECVCVRILRMFVLRAEVPPKLLAARDASLRLFPKAARKQKKVMSRSTNKLIPSVAIRSHQHRLGRVI